MKYYQIEHQNCFPVWVVAESAEQAIDFLKRHQFHGEHFSYSDVEVVEEETDFLVHRDEVEDWPFTTDSVPFATWVQTLTSPVRLHDSSDSWEELERNSSYGSRKYHN